MTDKLTRSQFIEAIEGTKIGWNRREGKLSESVIARLKKTPTLKAAYAHLVKGKSLTEAAGEFGVSIVPVKKSVDSIRQSHLSKTGVELVTLTIPLGQSDKFREMANKALEKEGLPPKNQPVQNFQE